MKYVALLLFALTLNLMCFSQDKSDSLFQSYSIRLNILGLPFKNISIMTDIKFMKRNYVDISTGFQISTTKKIHYSGLIASSIDPFYAYNRVKVGIGLKHYFSKVFYLGPFFQYRYSFFDKIYIERYSNPDGDAYDVDAIVSRTKNEMCYYLKLGISNKLSKHIILDSYIGIGFINYSAIDKVWTAITRYNVYNYDNPQKRIDNGTSFNILLGFAFGYYKLK